MTPRDLRTATWIELAHPLAKENGFRIWTAREVPGVVRLANAGKLYFRFNRTDYPNVDAVAKAYNEAEKGKRRIAPGSVESIRSQKVRTNQIFHR